MWSSSLDIYTPLWSSTKTGLRSSRAVVVALQSSFVLDRSVSSVSSSLSTLPGLDITVEASVLSLSSEIKKQRYIYTCIYHIIILEVAGIHLTYLWTFFLLSELFSILFYTFLNSPLQCTL